MPHLSRRLPRYCHHKATGRAVVYLSGRATYLGPYNSPESRARYKQAVADWLAGRTGPPHESSGVLHLTVSEVILRFRTHAQDYYRKAGQPTGEHFNIRDALRPVRKLFGHTPAADFGPKRLKEVQAEMVRMGWSRKYINRQINRVRLAFRWAASEELIPAGVVEGLRTVQGLREGRTAARETPAVRPITDDQFEAVLPHLPPTVADMVRVQRLAGMRPQEVVEMKAAEIDRTNPECWEYRPSRHKGQHHGRDRIIFLGPKAQAILAPYLARAGDGFVFSPARSEAARMAERRAARATPMTPSHRARRKRKVRRTRPPRASYSTHSYRRAITRACVLAFPHPTLSAIPAAERSPVQRAELRQWNRQHSWHPHRLRHSAATEIRRLFGLEASQAVLGHRELGVTQVYAERDMGKARDVMRQVG